MTKHPAQNGALPRIDPRRPFTIGPTGLIRITLGATHAASADGVHAHPTQDHHAVAGKPRRLVGHAASHPDKAAERSLMVAAYSDRGVLDAHAAEALAAAALLADNHTEVVLIVFGDSHDDVAALGADKVHVFPELERHRYVPDACLQALRACVERYRPIHLLMPDRCGGDGDLGRRYAAMAAKSIATQVVEIDARHVSVYADGRRQFASRPLPDVVLLAPNVVNTVLPFVGAGDWIDAAELGGRAVIERAPDTAVDVYRDLGLEAMDAVGLPLEEADLIVAAGNGVHDVPALERLAVTLGAAVGASRVAVDDGRFSRDKQIGATGKTVEASVYFAFGISGAVQHLQGIKSCRHVIAVNTDASAPISQRADLMIVDDAERVIEALTDVIGVAKKARDADAVLSREAPSTSSMPPAAPSRRNAADAIRASIDENARAVA